METVIYRDKNNLHNKMLKEARNFEYIYFRQKT